MMTKFQNFIHRYSAQIALYISITALISFTSEFYIFAQKTFYIIFNKFTFGIPYFTFFRNDPFDYEIPIDESSSYAVGLLTPGFLVVFLIGAILYYISNKTEKRLLQFSFAVIFLAKIVSLISLLLYVLTIENYIENYYQFTFYVFKTLLLLYIAYTFLKRSIAATAFRSTLKEKHFALSTDFYALNHDKASKGQRFLHYGIDVFVMILIFSKYLYIIPSEYLIAFMDVFGERFSSYILFFVVNIFYYLFFEGIFKTTPGKFLTQTRIVGFSEENVSFGQIITRTFSRKIPLEAFSFFSEVGWHDSISKTTVVQQQTDTIYSKWAIGILITSVILILYGFISYYFDYF